MWKTPKAAAGVAALLGALIVSSDFALAQGNTNRVSVPFSDPSRPGTVRINVFQGSLTVRASTGKEVVVTTDDPIVTTREGRETTVPPRPETVGLRRLSQPSGLRVVEENNVMTVSSGRFMGGEDLTVDVPARTNLNLSAFNDEISVEGVDGELEVTSVNGEINLRNVSGAVVAHATNGEVRVSLTRVTPDKPMSFTSLNGDVDVTLPASLRANFKLRSDRGEVYTDFDVQIQQQRPTPAPSRGSAAPPLPPPGSAAAPQPPQPPLPPLPPLPPNADADAVRARERANQARERQNRERRNRVEVDTAIYGSINGGGPEIELRTFNGDVFLRRGK
jgi:hypothetical protein